jgi:hypothetical protein
MLRRRVKPLEAAAHPFFDELRQEDLKLPNDVPVPALFNFSLQGTHAPASLGLLRPTG